MKIPRAFRSLGAVVAGYAVIVIGTILVLSILLENVTYAEASLWQHAVGAIGTILSGLLGGYVAARLSGRQPVGHALGVVLILVVEMTWILTTGVGSNPAWFDAAGGLTLMVMAVLGALAYAKRGGLQSPA